MQSARKRRGSASGRAGGNSDRSWWQSITNHPWFKLLRRTFGDSATDRVTQWAAAVAYYTLLSVFPLLVAAVAIAAYFVDPDWAIRQLGTLLQDYLPEGDTLVRETVRQVLAARGTAGVLSIALLIWSGMRVFGSLTSALNVAFDVDEIYGFLRRLLVEFAMLVTLGVLFLLSVVAGFALNFAQGELGRHLIGTGPAFSLLRALISPALLFVTFTLTYRYVPRRRPGWKSALWGAVAATLLFLGTRFLFFVYLDRFAQYNLIYGSLSVIIGMLVWSWLAALVVLIGAELASHYQMMFVEGSSEEEVERRHRERTPTS